MRILHTIETHGPGGAESVLMSLAVAAAEDGWPAPQGFFIKEGWLADQFRERAFPVTVKKNRRTFDGPLVRGFADVVRKNRVELIHVHEIGMGSYAAIVAAMLQVPVIWTVHGRSESASSSRLKRVSYGLAMRRSTVVSVSRDLAGWIAGTYYLRLDDVRVIANGIDTSPFDGADRCSCRADLRGRLGLPEDAVIAVAVARLFPVKNHDLMLRAFRDAAECGTAARLLLVGDGPERGRLTRLCRQMGMEAVVHFLGERPDVPDILSSADLFFLTSRSEGRSIAIMEAMAAGLPVLATRVGDNEVLVEDGNTGFLVTSQDQEALADRMKRLLADARARRRMGRLGRERVEKRFSRRRMWAEYKQVYEQARGRR